MNPKESPILDQLDKETADRILDAVSEADYQIRRAKRNLRSRVRTLIAHHSDQVTHVLIPPKCTHINTPVDYEKLLEILDRQPITYEIIKNVTGLTGTAVAEVITTLSLKYPLWQSAKGVYELVR